MTEWTIKHVGLTEIRHLDQSPFCALVSKELLPWRGLLLHRRYVVYHTMGTVQSHMLYFRTEYTASMEHGESQDLCG